MARNSTPYMHKLWTDVFEYTKNAEDFIDRWVDNPKFFSPDTHTEDAARMRDLFVRKLSIEEMAAEQGKSSRDMTIWLDLMFERVYPHLCMLANTRGDWSHQHRLMFFQRHAGYFILYPRVDWDK